MQLLWILPSLGYGVYLWATTGQAYGLIFGLLSVASAIGNFFVQRNSRAVDLRDPVWFSDDRVAIGNRVLPKWEWRWRAEWADRVYEEIDAQVAKRNSALAIQAKLSVGPNPTAVNRRGLSAWLGFVSAEPLELDITDEGFHAVIVGATGSGKSQLLTGWLHSLVQVYGPAQLSLALFDFKGGACLGAFSQLSQAAGMATDLDGSAQVLLEVVAAELPRRERLLGEAGVSRVQDLPEAVRPPYLVTVVDEVLPLLAIAGAQQTLEAIASRGRSLGVHLIVTGQSLVGIPRGLLGNLGARFLVGKPDPVEMAQLGMAKAEALAVEVEADLAQAILATNRRQVRFGFTSNGQASRKNLLSREALSNSPNGNPMPPKTSEFAELRPNIYEFSDYP